MDHDLPPKPSLYREHPGIARFLKQFVFFVDRHILFSVPLQGVLRKYTYVLQESTEPTRTW